MTKISQQRVRAKAQTYEEKVAEVYNTVVKPIMATRLPAPKPDYLGIFLGVPAFFLGLPLIYVIYFPVCAIIMETANFCHFVISQLVRLL